MSENLPELNEWFRVQFDDAAIQLRVNPPNRPAWEARINWARIIRVCLNAGDSLNPDEIFIFTDERPESYLIPIHADGADKLWDEIITRELFDAELAILAMSAANKLFCWPSSE